MPDYDCYKETVDEINRLINEICNNYDNMIDLGMKKLGVAS